MKFINLFQSMISEANNIVISTHIHPDADGIGSQIALCLALRGLGKNVTCVNNKTLLERYHYLDLQKTISSVDKYSKEPYEKIDLFIIVDTNSLERVGAKVKKLALEAKSLLYIDHHPCPKELKAIHCIDTEAAATGELIGVLLESLNINFTKELALPLYTAIIIDTSSFRYPTVTARTHRLVSKLLDSGVTPPEAYNYIYGSKNIPYMKLLGAILTSAEASASGKVAWLTILESDLDEFHIDPEDTHGFINHLLIMNDLKVACMFRQIGEKVKISFRSSGDIDVSIIAQAFGGGGHNHSSATMITGDIKEIITDMIPKIELMLED